MNSPAIKQDEWFETALLKYSDAREAEMAQEFPFSHSLIRQVSTLECSIIRYNYIYMTRTILEPQDDMSKEFNIDDSLMCNLFNDLYGNIDTQGEPYQKYIAPFLDND